MKKIMVLGGTGFVGAHVCEKLVREGWRVTVLTRRRANARHLLHLPLLTVLECNVHDEAALAAALAGHDAVINLVAILHGSQAAFDKVHVALPQKLARACRAARVRQLVHLSALGADALQPQVAPSMYLRSKSQGEAALMQAAASGAEAPFALTILRPSVIFGAEDKLLKLHRLCRWPAQMHSFSRSGWKMLPERWSVAWRAGPGCPPNRRRRCWNCVGPRCLA